VTDPDGDPLTVTVTSIYQDEALKGLGSGDQCPDASGIGTSQPVLRAERDGTADGRMYHVSFRADDGRGGSCTGSVTVCVPHDMGNGQACVDGGALVNSTGSCG